MIEVEHISVTLGGSPILSEVDLTVPSGTFLGLIGPNGAGKSTLLRTINGIISPSTGGVIVAGEDVHSLDPKAVSRLIATVPQDTAIAFDFDVRSVVAMGRTPYRGRLGGRDEAGAMAVERALERTQTHQFADRTVGSLSGGERQRVVIARALAQETPVILLDEPTASLDINHQVRTLELIRNLVDDEAKTVVAAIHDLNLAAHYCDELALLSEGSIVERGSPDDVLTEEALEATFGTKAFVTRHPITGSVYVAPIPGGPDLDRDGHVHVIGGGGTASRLLYLLTSTGYRVSIGALNEGDSDLATARQFGLETIVIPPFAPVDDETAAAVASVVDEADLTIVADVEIGEGNLANLKAAARSDDLLVVEGRPVNERNYAGEQGRAAYRDLRSAGIVVDEQEVLAAVERLLAPSQGKASLVEPVRLVDGGEETDRGAQKR